MCVLFVVLCVLPLCVLVAGGEGRWMVVQSNRYEALRERSFKAVAICSVDGGPEYEAKLQVCWGQNYGNTDPVYKVIPIYVCAYLYLLCMYTCVYISSYVHLLIVLLLYVRVSMSTCFCSHAFSTCHRSGASVSMCSHLCTCISEFRKSEALR